MTKGQKKKCMLWIDKIQAQILNIKVFEQETECSKGKQ